jgi:hypothetical protein
MNKDQKLGIALILFCIVLWFYAIPFHISGNAPKFFPRLITIFIFIPGILLIFSRKGKVEKPIPGLKDLKGVHKALITAGLFLIYISLIDIVGYFTITSIAIMVFLFFFGSRSLKGIILIPAAILFFIYLVIERILSFPLPKGFIY